MVELKTLLIAAIAAYAGIAALAWAAQDRMLFYPRAASAAAAAPAGWRLEPVRFAASDGTRLAGVLLLPPGPPAPLLIHFGGNAEEVTEYAALAEQDWGRRAVLLVNYRGYGESEGAPGERAMVSDAMELFDWASRRSDVDASRVAVHGRSLGSGVAVQLAAARPVRCLLLTSPFASVTDVARVAYPWLPVSLLLRHRFDSLARAPQVRAPALVAVGEEDRLIPPSHSERLARALAGPVSLVRIPGGSHNDLHLHPRYGESVRAFLEAHH